MSDQKKLNKSEQIRQLHDAGLTVMEIAKTMGIRYQFAYNVVSYYIRQKNMEVIKLVGATGDNSVRDNTSEGNTNQEMQDRPTQLGSEGSSDGM